MANAPVLGACLCGEVRFEIDVPTLFCESTLHPDYVDVVLANLDGAVEALPQAHFYFDDRAPWVAIADDLPRFGGKTGTEPL